MSNWIQLANRSPQDFFSLDECRKSVGSAALRMAFQGKGELGRPFLRSSSSACVVLLQSGLQSVTLCLPFRRTSAREVASNPLEIRSRLHHPRCSAERPIALKKAWLREGDQQASSPSCGTMANQRSWPQKQQRNPMDLQWSPGQISCTSYMNVDGLLALGDLHI